jgi:hypothetical protein
MTNTMTVAYETVKYFNGAVGGNQPSSTVVGFADPNRYDVQPSGISRPGSQATVFGQGGLVDAGIGILEDLNALQSGQGGLQNVLGAVQAAGATIGTLQNNPNINVRAELQQAGQQILQTSLPGAVRQAANSANGQLFPKAPKLGTGVGSGILGPSSRIGF